MKTIGSVLSASALAVVLLLAASTANAQEKPKGKPWPAPDNAVKMKNPVKADDASVAEGKELWAQHCKSCHGAKGKGDGTKAEKIDISCGDFTSAEFAKASDGELYWKTTEGRKPMPSFKENFGFHPRLFNLETSNTFRGVPSGNCGSNARSPLNPVTSLIRRAKSLMVTSSPLPTLIVLDSL